MVKQERLVIQLADLQSPEKNVRMHPERQVKEIMRSLDQFGQCRDIVLDENNTVLAGNGLWEAMQRRGDTEAAAIRLSGLSEKQKLKFMLADNKTFSLGVEDLDGINFVLEQLGTDLDVPGYDEDTLKALVATAEDVTEKLMDYGTIDESQIADIKARGERKEAMMQQANEPPPLATDEHGDVAAGDSSDEASAEVRKSVICPKCGERIWL